MSPIYNTLISLIGGAGIGSYFVHALTLRREKATREHADRKASSERKKAFAAFVRRLRSDIDTKSSIALAEVWSTYASSRSALWGEAERVRADFKDAASFDKLMDDAASVQYEAVQNESSGDYRRPIVEPLDTLLKYVRSQIPSEKVG